MQQLLQFDSMSDLVAAAAETPLKKTRLNTMRTRQERIELDEEEDVALRKYLVGAIRGLGDFTGCLVVEKVLVQAARLGGPWATVTQDSFDPWPHPDVDYGVAIPMCPTWSLCSCPHRHGCHLRQERSAEWFTVRHPMEGNTILPTFCLATY